MGSNDRSNIEARGWLRGFQGRQRRQGRQGRHLSRCGLAAFAACAARAGLISPALSRLPYRRMSPAEPVAVVPSDAALIAAWQGGDERAVAGEAEARLLQHLPELPRMQREVFLLRAQQGLDYEEIAAALGTTPGAARVHYHHAVKRLKEHLQ